MADYQSSYTGAQIDTAIANVNAWGDVDARLTTAEQQLSNHYNTLVTHENRLNGWEASALTYQSVTGNAGITLHCYRQGNIVSIVINNTATGTIAAWGIVGTLPERYRPRYQVFADNPLNSGQGFYIGNIETGEVNTNAQITSGTGCWCTMTYIART